MTDDHGSEAKPPRPKAHPYHDVRYPYSVDEQGAFAEYILRAPDSMPDLGLGTRVIIQDPEPSRDTWLDATVIGLRAISPFSPERESLLYIEDDGDDPQLPLEDVYGPHTHQPLLIKVRLHQELSKQDGGGFVSSAVQRPPSARSRLMFPQLLPGTYQDEPSLAELLDIRPKGLRMGAVGFGSIPYRQSNDFLEYLLDIDELDNKHMFIVGESGSGKTVLLKQLALQIRQHSDTHRVIMTDVQGDVAQLFLGDIISPLERRGWQAHIQAETAEQAAKALEPLNLVIPVPGRSGKLDDASTLALKKLAQNRGVKVHEIGLRLQDLQYPSDVEYLFRVASEQTAGLLDEEAETITNNGNAVTLARLRTAVQNLLAQNGNNLFGSGGTTWLRSTAASAMRAMKNLSNYFDSHQSSMQSSNNPLDVLGNEGTTIFYLEHLSFDERLMWEMQLVKWLYDNKRKDTETFVFIDEAHQIIPARPQGTGAKETFARLRGIFEKLAREGRKFGIHLILSTQSPRDLHEIVPEQCPTRIVMKIDPKNASHAYLDKEYASIAGRFTKGQFWLRSPFNGSPDWVRIHGWAPHLPHEPMVHFWRKIQDQAAKPEER